VKAADADSGEGTGRHRGGTVGGHAVIELFGWTVDQGDVVAGVVRGLAYALMAVGIVLVYRTTGVINFAHAAVGGMAGMLLTMFAVTYNWPYWIALVMSIAAGALLAAIIELVVVRRLFRAPRLILFVATLGAAQLVFVITLQIVRVTKGKAVPSALDSRPGARYDVFGLFDFPLSFEPTEHIRLLARDLSVLVVAPIAIVLVSLFMQRTRFGLAVRAAASNGDTSRLFGISVKRVSTIVWAMSGALAALTVALIAPFNELPSPAAGADPLSFTLLLRVLTVALLAGMRSLPMTLPAGVLVGFLEVVVRGHYRTTPEVFDAVLFVLVLVVVLLRGRTARDEGGWSLAPRIRPVPVRLQELWWVKRMSLLGTLLGLLVLVLVPVLSRDPGNRILYTQMLLYSIVGLTVTLLTGWAGQLSMGQFAFVGLGTLTTMALRANQGWSFGAALAVSTAVGLVAALLIGLPALRVRGLYLAITTLAFAVASTSWLFRQDALRADGSGGSKLETVPAQARLRIGGTDLSGRSTFYFLCLAVLVLVFLLVAQVRSTGLGRSMLAVRDNEEMAAACTVRPARIKLAAFGIAGALAALSGGLLLMTFPGFDPSQQFPASESTRIVAITIIGGLGSLVGPLLGSLWVIGIPALFRGSTIAPLLTSGVGLLVLLMYFPGGLVQILYAIRDQLLAVADRRLGDRAAPAAPSGERHVPARPARAALALEPGQPWLAAEHVTVRFGGRVAVDDVSIEVHRGELVGLIGTNGAGKTTLMNAISGSLRMSSGRIEVLGRDVSNLSMPTRHQVGLGRGFQAARLFPDLTVRETVQVALEARATSPVLASMVRTPPSPRLERVKRAEAEEIITFLGLGRYAERFISELSTGTRRIVELACLLAVDARVLMLDEPTGGVAQRETEAFGPLIQRIQRELDASVLLIEHDMPLVTGISDRIYCLEAGQVIAVGNPRDIRNDPRVIASYLGTDERAIQRSGQRATTPAPVR
jgi:ABC-type branched-subunit amino acid transport system ATPase component/ABC-type branched-subunit amino acid transport system permease subunit